ALKLLDHIDLNHTNDPETVTIAGAIEKKYYELGQGVQHLSNAILFFQRGFFLLNNRYNSINLAYTLNCRANSSLCSTREAQIADMVYASHTRRRVIYICKKELKDIQNKETRWAEDQRTGEMMDKDRAYY